MSDSRKWVWIFSLLFLSGAMDGCGSAHRIESSQLPGPALSGGGSGSKAELKASGSYIVQRHDCLWAIAGKPGIYGDSFQWPLLFKANRDRIQDPDLIYPRQDLSVERGVSQAERDHARRTAMLTPKYVPHTKPRQTLPVDYF